MILGIDTSNYKTSAALFDGVSGEWRSEGRFLDVEQGKLGLRQSEALFQHVKYLPDVIKSLGTMGNIEAVGYSDKPRETEDSYMPCFLAGRSVAESIASSLNIPAFHFSHQQGHIASALLSINKLELMKKPFLAWHLSGGTTELLFVRPDDEIMIKAEIIGGTTDISAGQSIDRCGVALDMPFPAGKYVEQAALRSDITEAFTARCNGGHFSLSGLENKFKAMMEKGAPAEDVCRFTLLSVGSTIYKATQWVREQYSGLPVLISGGVSVCSIVRDFFAGNEEIYFAESGLGGDNAVGTAVLAHMEMTK